MIRSLIAAGILVAAPAAAVAQPESSPMVATTPPLDPARLAAAQKLALKLVPPGTYQRMMSGSLKPVMGSLFDQVLDTPAKRLIGSLGFALQLPVMMRVAQDEAPKPEVWTLDQLRIDRVTESAKVDQLAAAHTLDQAMDILKRQHVPFVQARATLRPGSLPTDVRAQIAALPPGEPFVLPDGDFISINVIVGRTPPPAAIGWFPHRLPPASRAGLA